MITLITSLVIGGLAVFCGIRLIFQAVKSFKK